MIKPRLRKLGLSWTCSAMGHVGVLAQPFRAFTNWLLSMNMTLSEFERAMFCSNEHAKNCLHHVAPRCTTASVVHGALENVCAPCTTSTTSLEDVVVRCTVHGAKRGVDKNMVIQQEGG